MITIAVTDDHALMRQGIVSIFRNRNDFRVVIEAKNGRDLLEQLAGIGTLPDIILLDVNMPVMNGEQTLKVLKQRYPLCKVVVLSLYGDDDMVKEFMQTGAAGYLSKDTVPEKLFKALQDIYLSGNTPV